MAQLEAEFERGQDAGDLESINRVAEELQFRTTAKAKALQKAIEVFRGRPTSAGAKTKPPRADAKPRTAQKQGATSSQNRRKLRPTEEQQRALDQFGKGGSLKINAYAGTGKTSTLEMLAHSSAKRGQYIAFNRDIVSDAKDKFPESVNCSTTHGLAFRALPSAYKNSMDKMTKRLNANQLAEALNLQLWKIDRNHSLQPRSQAFLVLDTLRRFMQSADEELAASHVRRHGSLISASDATMAAVVDFALHAAKYTWSRMKDSVDPMPLGHDGYLKLWALSRPRIAADFILLDEAQDTNPVVLDVLCRQQSQMIYVGDKYQQIYEWRGAVNAMEKIETTYTTFLTTSFRFGPTIANAATKLLHLLNERRPIKGNPAMSSRIGKVDPNTILARTNSSTVSAVIEAIDAGKKPYLVGGTDEVMELLRGVQDLKEGRQSTVPDFFGFDKWSQVVEFAKSGEGDHLQSFVNLVEARGERQLMWALNRTVEEDVSNLTISTAHKAKGREWKTVRLMDDFLRSQPTKAPADKPAAQLGHDPAEMRLFYVAFTRAREAIEVPASTLALVS